MTRDLPSLLAELRRLVICHADDGRLPIAGLGLARVDAPTAPTSSIAEPVLTVVAQGTTSIALGDHVYECGAGDYLVVAVDLPVTAHFSRASPEQPFLGVALDLRPDTVGELLLDAGVHGGDPRPRREVGGTPSRSAGVARVSALAVDRTDGPLLDAVVRLLRLLDRPEDAAVLAPVVEREILRLLLAGGQGELVRQMGLTGSSLAQVGQAVRWVREHHDEPFRVEELAERVNMSASSFHRHFRAATTMGPIQFQKRVRLQRARLLLLGGTRDVTSVAHTVGYESLSQFSREYRREFGASPTGRAGRLRVGAGAALALGPR